MKVKILRNTVVDGLPVREGEEKDLLDKDAKTLIAMKKAELITNKIVIKEASKEKTKEEKLLEDKDIGIEADPDLVAEDSEEEKNLTRKKVKK